MRARIRGSDPELMSAESEEANSRTEVRLDISTVMKRYFCDECESVDSRDVALDRDRNAKSAVSVGSGSAARAWAIERPRRPFEPTKKRD
jgi:hypothetical protein